MQNSWPIVESVLGVFLVIALGALSRQIGWLNRESDKSLANLTTNVLLPAYFLQKILLSDHPILGMDVLTAPLFGLGVTSLGFVLALLFSRQLGPKIGLTSDSSQRAFALCVGVCNYGFIPLPLAEQYYPDALVDLILHNVGVNLALWSVGIAVISGTMLGGLKKAFLTPPFLSVIVAVICRQQMHQTSIPSSVSTCIESVGGCAIPMGLLLSGAIMVDFIKEATWRGSFRIVLAAIGLRHLIFPVLILLTASLMCDSTTMREVMLLQAAMPAAIFPIVIVKLYDHDLDTALRVVLASSLFGVLTIPIWLTVGANWLLP
ncbi:MAG: AEC family transporter [Rubripirellula sp.]|nr:AEC family transporter [Rubripirellula sp.]